MKIFEDTTMFVAICALALGIIAVTGDSSHSGNNTCKVCGSNQQVTNTDGDGVKSGNDICNDLNTKDPGTKGQNHQCLFEISNSGDVLFNCANTSDRNSKIVCQRNDQYTSIDVDTCDGQNLDCNARNAGLFSSSS
jgi:hypothetical protein